MPSTDNEVCFGCGKYREEHHPKRCAYINFTPDAESGPSPCGMYGWSIKAGALREALAYVPPDYEVMLSNADVDDISISGLRVGAMYPPFRGAPGIVVLEGGQVLDHEYAFGHRMDRDHDGTEEAQRWVNGEWLP